MNWQEVPAHSRPDLRKFLQETLRYEIIGPDGVDLRDIDYLVTGLWSAYFDGYSRYFFDKEEDLVAFKIMFPGK